MLCVCGGGGGGGGGGCAQRSKDMGSTNCQVRCPTNLFSRQLCQCPQMRIINVTRVQHTLHRVAVWRKMKGDARDSVSLGGGMCASLVCLGHTSSHALVSLLSAINQTLKVSAHSQSSLAIITCPTLQQKHNTRGDQDVETRCCRCIGGARGRGLHEREATVLANDSMGQNVCDPRVLQHTSRRAPFSQSSFHRHHGHNHHHHTRRRLSISERGQHAPHRAAA
jgi:hypothetical protein